MGNGTCSSRRGREEPRHRPGEGRGVPGLDCGARLGEYIWQNYSPHVLTGGNRRLANDLSLTWKQKPGCGSSPLGPAETGHSVLVKMRGNVRPADAA